MQSTNTATDGVDSTTTSNTLNVTVCTTTSNALLAAPVGGAVAHAIQHTLAAVTVLTNNA
jgi:hypothetical protein